MNRKVYAVKRLCRTSVRCVFRRRFEDSTSKIGARHVSALSTYRREAMCESVDSDTSASGERQTASFYLYLFRYEYRQEDSRKEISCNRSVVIFMRGDCNSAQSGDQLRDFDMDMSYARRVRTASLTSYSVSCKILHQRTASHSVTNDVTRPLVCARITCYITVIM
jgi:hypothetical protein